ncbi:GH32 C-terminal domain-containing protein [Streptomyces sp. NPDC051133]|uniref:GH32 C-terminal domain-containing protein n=1 Tax=Streptomyces sp. NPDC051133 TaxID=3155521 RepID=UPI003434B374
MPVPARIRRTALTALAAAVCLGLTAASPAVAGTAPYHETYRPQVHFTPAKNWMNDPNGLIWHKGQYHLFYQYNPQGNTWGHMSWGHAVSTDLVHWKQLPLALPEDDQEMVFSGSVVLDKDNTTGFGTRKNPALVAVYTSAYQHVAKQAQSLAYSTDGGLTWTKYSGNPVLDIGSAEFRDPKVFWYAPTRSWRMVAVKATEHKVAIYSSPDLKSWTHLSDFGPAGATGGVWECPDLFELPVDGDPHRTRWVMVVNLNPGGPAGGSGAQYFTGAFDGTTFAPDDGPYTPPPGSVLQDFESGTYGDWTATGTAFGSAPATGTLPGQQNVSGFTGQGLVNSFLGGDATTGILTSPAFTVDRPYLNFEVGGGNHPHIDGAGDGSAPAGETLADFEGPTFGAGWTTTGDFAGTRPRREKLDGSLGDGVLDTFETADDTGDQGTGTVTSPEFTITRKYIDFLIAGGNHPQNGDAPTAFDLLVDGKVVRTATGKDSGTMDWTSWDVGDLIGKKAVLQATDRNTGGWGHVMVDNVVVSDHAAPPIDRQTAVNLVVDGKVVRTATGGDSEALDWNSWDLKDLRGKQARIQVVDHATGGWGHLLADRFTLADAPAHNALQRAHWLDHGADFYAAATYNDTPGGRRVMIGWMNNWAYANNIPTNPWRSADAFPRELTLTSSPGHGVELVQQPVSRLRTLRDGAPVSVLGTTITDGIRPLPASGSPVEIEARFKPGTARQSGIEVRVGAGQRTRIGYDAATGELYLDRTASGDVSFADGFAAVHRAPVSLDHGTVDLHIVVDASSVEVYTADGRAVLTDQIFPDPSATGIRAFAEGGTATLSRLKVWKLKSAWSSR